MDRVTTGQLQRLPVSSRNLKHLAPERVAHATSTRQRPDQASVGRAWLVYVRTVKNSSVRVRRNDEHGEGATLQQAGSCSLQQLSSPREYLQDRLREPASCAPVNRRWWQQVGWVNKAEQAAFTAPTRQ